MRKGTRKIYVDMLKAKFKAVYRAAADPVTGRQRQHPRAH